VRLTAWDNVANRAVQEVSATVSSVTKYYYHGSRRVAVRKGGQVYYLHRDHLGSTSLTTDSSGNVVHEARYLPYGQVRWESGASTTDFGFTGQRDEASFGLMDFNARYYSPRLGTFIQPDTIVPDPTKGYDLNRYLFVRGNPLKYADPTGHDPCRPNKDCVPFPAHDVQTVDDGVGETYHRQYQVTISQPSMSPSEAFEHLKANFTKMFPNTSVFEAHLGENGKLDVGDRFVIRQLDPVFGTGAVVRTTQVYVSEATENSFTLVTQQGHPEAGAITFTLTGDADSLQLNLSSETTAGGVADYLAYITVGKVLQTDVWGHFLQQSVKAYSAADSQVSAKLTATATRSPSYEVAPRRSALRALSVATE
jgi:RHS repeat-associated protein